MMRVFASVLLLATVLGGTCASSIKARRAVDSFVSYITYRSETDDVLLSQRVTVTKDEARLKAKGGMDVVIDYKQELLIYADASGGEVCHVARFDISIVPGPEEIQALIEENEGNFIKPKISKKLSYRPSKDQTKPELLALAAELCEGKKVVRMEETTGSPRDKREVGVGEVVVIIVAVVLLGFLG